VASQAQVLPSSPAGSSYGGFPYLEPETPEVQAYAHRVTGGSDAVWIYSTALVFVRTHRFIYWKNQPGDCGSETKISLGNPGTTGAKISATGASFLSGIGLSSLAGPLVIAAFPLAILGGIFQHHAMAVALEQSTLCKVAVGYNGFADAMEAALKARKIGLQDANAQLLQAEEQLNGALDSIAKECNAACGYKKALHALVLFNQEKLYPGLVGGLGQSLLGPLVVAGGYVAAKVVL